jgi:hypothetical protein
MLTVKVVQVFGQEKTFSLKRRGTMEKTVRLLKCCLPIMVVSFLLFFPVMGFGGGGNQYPLGSEAFFHGAVPPPGFYVKDYVYFYTADKLMGDDRKEMKVSNGDPVQLDDLDVWANTLRLIYVSPIRFLDGFLGTHLFIPLVNVDETVTVATPGGPLKIDDDKTAIANLIWNPVFWSYHSQNGLFHAVTGCDIYIPVGPYDGQDLVNIRKNFWTFEIPLGITWFMPFNPNIQVGAKFMYDFNTEDNDYYVAGVKTDRLPGQEFKFDYGVSYAFAKKDSPVQVWGGVNGYAYWQTTHDEIDGHKVDDDMSQVFAAGPGILATYKNWVFDLHGAWEFEAKNRPEGFTGVFSVIYAFK